MADLSYFYLILDVILLGYTCYSWFWQASIDIRGHYRTSSVVWALIFIWISFAWDLLSPNDPGLGIFLAIFILMSILDGTTGLAPKRAVVSGYFKRTIAYTDVEMVTLIKVPNPKKKTVICILTTKKHRQYYLRFSAGIAQVIETLKTRIDHNTKIEVQNIM
ncbi:hypothetical protein OZX56_08570 [Lactobacillus sp. ESL0684]|uniref:hypothetical protein n=1 Tax=unclassified Lactobacillus TaxID=2620435 RepID=UPI0023F93F36|nr:MULTISPECIES: hypothetical protein [unclassified Lactobacillus]WEV39911.1 hypothetical protein OZX59_06780 [Lactobacillus sp. ESL0681]WEV43541.1 hypothetical protein OZX56_08570 [Lactobacillus sp. ESL0684]